MEQTRLAEDLMLAEAYLMHDQAEAALEILTRHCEDVEDYIDKNCPASEEEQWFSFSSLFERLAYRMVEQDPRTLHQINEPFDRLYEDLSLAYVHTGDYERGIQALQQAVRWNPMECSYRLNAAELLRTNGDQETALKLAFSVFERASQAEHLCRAFVMFAQWYESCGRFREAAAALRAARHLEVADGVLEALLQRTKDTEADPDLLDDAEMHEVLEAEGLPDGANAQVAVCLLMCAQDALQADDMQEATRLTLQARDLVGESALKALQALVSEGA